MAEYRDKTANPSPETSPKGVGLDGDWKDVWMALLPNMSFSDLDSVANTCPKAEEILNQYYKSGENLRIDVNVLLRFPTKMYKKVYKRLGQKVNSLTLSNISEDKAETLFAYFDNLLFLCLEKMEILKDDSDGYPVGIKSLKIVRCRINPNLMGSWFPALNPTLTSLHLDELIYGSFQSPTFCRRGFKSTCFTSLSKIQELTMLNMDCSDLKELLGVNESKLKSLTYNSFEFCSPISDVLAAANKTLQSLEYLSMDHLLYPDAMDEMFKGLEILMGIKRYKSVSKYWHFMLFPALKRLRIRRALDIVQRDELNKLSIPKLKIDWCYDPPAHPNAILQLNDDCLLKILSYLPRAEVQWIGETHSRFHNLALRMKHLLIDKDFLAQYPITGPSQEVYEQLGKSVEVLYISESEGLQVLPYFEKVKFLSLMDMTIDTGFTNFEWFPHGVATFAISECILPRQFVSKLCRRLAGIKSFLVKKNNRNGFIHPAINELANIRELIVTDHMVDIGLLQPFFSSNKDHLRVLKLEVTLPNPNSLIPLLNLPALEELSLTVFLTERQFEFNFWALADYVGTKAPLRKFTLDVISSREINCIKLSERNSLQHLTYFSTLFVLDMSYIEDLLPKLPKLIKMDAPLTTMPLHFETKLRAYLKKENRSFCINRVKIN